MMIEKFFLVSIYFFSEVIIPAWLLCMKKASFLDLSDEAMKK
jgi:hypothetical protein